MRTTLSLCGQHDSVLLPSSVHAVDRCQFSSSDGVGGSRCYVPAVSAVSVSLRCSVFRLHVLCYFFVFIFFRVAGTVPCRPDLMVKKLRYYARFIVVCLLLKKMKLVRDLVRVSRRSVLFVVVCVAS